MRKAYHNQSRDAFWNRYWRAVGRDVNDIEDVSVYPLFPVDRYLQPTDRILEAGCGLGRVLKHYQRRNRDITGLEYDGFCVQQLRQEDRNLRLVRASITNLPFEDGSFDVVMAFGVLGHIEDGLRRALDEVARVLRPGGYLAGSLCLDNFGRRVQQRIEERHIRHRGERHFYTHLLSQGEIRRHLADHGLTVTEMHPVHSRQPYFQLPLLRRWGGKNGFSHCEARNAEKGFKLNWFGETLYRVSTGCLRWSLAFTCSFMARKEGGLSHA